MESKQLTRKLNSIFWWTLTALPLLIILGYLISSILNFNTQGGTPVNVATMQAFWNSIDIEGFFDSPTIDNLQNLIPSIFTSSLDTMLEAFGVEDTYIVTILSWIFGIQFYHFILDVLLFVIRWAHDLLERGGKRC